MLLPLSLTLGFGILRRPNSCILAVVSRKQERGLTVFRAARFVGMLVQLKHRQQAGSYRCCFALRPTFKRVAERVVARHLLEWSP